MRIRRKAVMEPRSWLEEDATELEKTLLRAGRMDGPRDDAGMRILAAILGPSPADSVPADARLSHRVESDVAGQVAGAATSAKQAVLVRWVKMGLFALGMGGIVPVAIHVARSRGAVPSAMPAAALATGPATTASSEAIARIQASDTSQERQDLAPAQGKDAHVMEGRGNVQGARSNPPRRDREAARDTGERPFDRTLGDETVALDRAREALNAHRPSEGLRVLDEYHRRFPQGRLRPEATVLRLAALLQAGKRAAAESLASRLLADEAYQAYAPRIRSLLKEATP
jgi:hypothetical protein